MVTLINNASYLTLLNPNFDNPEVLVPDNKKVLMVLGNTVFTVCNELYRINRPETIVTVWSNEDHLKIELL